MRPRSSRSAAVARATTSTRSVPSRTAVTGDAGEQRLQGLRHVLRVEAERAGALLVDDEAHGGRHLVPVEMRVDHVRRSPASRRAPAYAMSRTAVGSGPTTRNWTGKPTGGPKLKRSTRTRASRERAVRDRRLDPRLDALARLDVLRHDDDLGEGLVRELRVEAEPEARRALADIGRVGGDVGIVAEDALGLARPSRP